MSLLRHIALDLITIFTKNGGGGGSGSVYASENHYLDTMLSICLSVCLSASPNTILYLVL